MASGHYNRKEIPTLNVDKDKMVAGGAQEYCLQIQLYTNKIFCMQREQNPIGVSWDAGSVGRSVHNLPSISTI